MGLSSDRHRCSRKPWTYCPIQKLALLLKMQLDSINMAQPIREHLHCFSHSEIQAFRHHMMFRTQLWNFWKGRYVWQGLSWVLMQIRNPRLVKMRLAFLSSIVRIRCLYRPPLHKIQQTPCKVLHQSNHYFCQKKDWQMVFIGSDILKDRGVAFMWPH